MRQKKQTKQQDILFILISSFVVVVAWIGFNLYHIWATSTVAPEVQTQLVPIDPKFDPVVLEQLKSRENINPLYQSQQTASAAAEPTPTPTSTTDQTPVNLQNTTASQDSRFAPENGSINRLGQ